METLWNCYSNWCPVCGSYPMEDERLSQELSREHWKAYYRCHPETIRHKGDLEGGPIQALDHREDSDQGAPSGHSLHWGFPAGIRFNDWIDVWYLLPREIREETKLVRVEFFREEGPAA